MELFRRAGHEVDLPRQGHLSRDEILERVGGADALVCLLSDRVDEELLARAPRLKVIANLGVGVDNIDFEAVNRRRIPVTNTPDVLTETTADLAWALLLAAARRVVEADRDLREHEFPGWTFIPPHLGVDVYGKTLGVVGLGRIGTAIARRGRGFGMKLLYTSRTRKPALEEELGLEYTPLPELLRRADFVVLAVPLTGETQHLIGEEELALMGRDSILVNISRGPVVDEGALARALKRGLIRAAALDVFEREPEVHPELLPLENVVLTPHIGSATLATRRAMARLAAEAVIDVLAGRRPANPVNQEAWPPAP